MQSIIQLVALVMCLFAVASAGTIPLQVLHDESGREFALVPIKGNSFLLSEVIEDLHPSRVRRQVSADVKPGQSGGTEISAGVAGNLYNDGVNKLDGNAEWSRTYHQPGVGTGPTSIGAGLNYENQNRGTASLAAQHTRGLGTQVDAAAGVKLWQSPDRNTRLDASGTYSQQFGGPGGRQPPSYGGLINFRHDFRR